MKTSLLAPKWRWLPRKRLPRLIVLCALGLLLGGCGVAGVAAIVAGIVLFCTGAGIPLIVAGLGLIYTEFEGDDPRDPEICCRPPLVDCPPPETPIPQGVLKVCWLNGNFPDFSRCALWRGSAVRANFPDRPAWSFDAHESTLNPQHITANPLRMSYPGGQDWTVEWNGNTYTMAGTSLICSLIFHDLNGDGRGDEWATVPDYYNFEAFYSNGDRVNSSASVALGGLGAPVYIGVGTTTLTHGWMPSGAKFYSFDFTPTALMMKATLTEEVFTEAGDVVELPSAEYAAMLVGASRGHWEEVDRVTFRFVPE